MLVQVGANLAVLQKCPNDLGRPFFETCISPPPGIRSITTQQNKCRNNSSAAPLHQTAFVHVLNGHALDCPSLGQVQLNSPALSAAVPHARLPNQLLLSRRRLPRPLGNVVLTVHVLQQHTTQVRFSNCVKAQTCAQLLLPSQAKQHWHHCPGSSTASAWKCLCTILHHTGACKM